MMVERREMDVYHELELCGYSILIPPFHPIPTEIARDSRDPSDFLPMHTSNTHYSAVVRRCLTDLNCAITR